MSEPEHQQRARELARLWQSQVIPVEDPSVVSAQRARVVPQLGAAIAHAAQGRRKALRYRRVVAAVSVAAAVLGAFGVGKVLVGRQAEVAEGPAALSASRASDVRALAGTVTLVNAAGPIAVSRANIEVGDALSTAPDGRAELRLTDLVLVELGGSSELSVVTPTASAHRVRLDRGHIHAKVNERPSPAPKLVVETPNVDVVVTGTVFQVDVVPRGAGEFVTTVSVVKGRVLVRHGAAQLAAVGAGQSWSSSLPAVAVQRVESLPRVAATPRRPAGAGVRPPRPGTLAEENALFQGAVDARNGGDDRAEAERLGALLNRYPSSPLAGEARVERMRALLRTGQSAEAAREARRYLAENPDGFASEEARRLVMQGGMSGRPTP